MAISKTRLKLFPNLSESIRRDLMWYTHNVSRARKFGYSAFFTISSTAVWCCFRTSECLWMPAILLCYLVVLSSSYGAFQSTNDTFGVSGVGLVSAKSVLPSKGPSGLPAIRSIALPNCSALHSTASSHFQSYRYGRQQLLAC